MAEESCVLEVFLEPNINMARAVETEKGERNTLFPMEEVATKENMEAEKALSPSTRSMFFERDMT